MGFSLQPNGQGRSQIILKDEPTFIVPLQIAPPVIEPMLMEGKWLIISFSVWSIKELDAAYRAIVVARKYGGQFRLGLRPYDYPEENLTWLPIKSRANNTVDIEEDEQEGMRIVSIKGQSDTSPIWAIVENGQFSSIEFGQLSEDDIDNLTQQILIKAC